MKSGVSILYPSIKDLERYGMLKYVDVGERPIWLGSPNMWRAVILSAPALIIFLIICCAYYRVTLGFGCANISVKVGFECGKSVPDARGKIFFDLLTVVLSVFSASVVMALRYVSYLLTDKYIHIFIEKNWCVEIASKTRMAISNNNSRHFRYELARLRRLEARSFMIDGSVGNIYLCNVNFDGTVSDGDVLCGAKSYKKTNETGLSNKIKNSRVVFAGSWTLSLVNVVYAVNGIEGVCDAISEIYAAGNEKY